jgi:putative endonuclease
MLTARQELGLRGERVAEAWLCARGWEVLDRRFRAGHRDLDLVAARWDEDGGRLVAFVEVRTRYSTARGTPAETVTWRKQRELARAARAWIALNKRSKDSYRFDVVGVLVVGRRARIQYVPDAFWLRGFV